MGKFFLYSIIFNSVNQNLSSTSGFLLELSAIEISKFEILETREPMQKILDKLDSKYSINESDYLRELVRCQNLIIAYTKKNDSIEVIELIDLSKQILNRLKNNSRKLGCIFVYPAFAFYYYKYGNDSIAKRYISLTVKYDDYLTHEYPELHLHKLHHLLNMNKIFIHRGDIEFSCDLIVAFLKYMFLFKLDPKYGDGGELFFENLAPDYGLHSASGSFLNEYFISVWESPKLEKMLLSSTGFKHLLVTKSTDKNLSSLQDYWTIQSTIVLEESSFSLILDFFKNYNYYLFDPLRLLLLRKLYNMVEENNHKEIIVDIISSKLNFKLPDLLVDRLVNNKLDI